MQVTRRCALFVRYAQTETKLDDRRGRFLTGRMVTTLVGPYDTHSKSRPRDSRC